jgi:hypothetical protein
LLLKPPRCKGGIKVDERFQDEQDCHDKTMFMQPTYDLTCRDPELARIQGANLKNRKKTKVFREYVLQTWKVNPTLFDAENAKTPDNVQNSWSSPWDSWQNLRALTAWED